MKLLPRRRRAQRVLCPACGSPFLWAQVGLTRKTNRMPVITSIHGALFCAACEHTISYSRLFLKRHNQ